MSRETWAPLRDHDSSRPADREYAQSAVIAGFLGLLITIWAAALAYGKPGVFLVLMAAISVGVLSVGACGLGKDSDGSER